MTGIFAQRDLIGFAGGDLNLYAYVWNDPVNWTDPSGLSSMAVEGRAVAGIGIASAADAMNVMMRWCLARPNCAMANLQRLAQGVHGIAGALGVGDTAGTGEWTAGTDDYAQGATKSIAPIFVGILGLVDTLLQNLDEIGRILRSETEGGNDEGPEPNTEGGSDENENSDAEPGVGEPETRPIAAIDNDDGSVTIIGSNGDPGVRPVGTGEIQPAPLPRPPHEEPAWSRIWRLLGGGYKLD